MNSGLEMNINVFFFPFIHAGLVLAVSEYKELK